VLTTLFFFGNVLLVVRPSSLADPGSSVCFEPPLASPLHSVPPLPGVPPYELDKGVSSLIFSSPPIFHDLEPRGECFVLPRGPPPCTFDSSEVPELKPPLFRYVIPPPFPASHSSVGSANVVFDRYLFNRRGPRPTIPDGELPVLFFALFQNSRRPCAAIHGPS